MSQHRELDLRLPSEAEWEYACRAGTTTPYSFGDTARPDEINFHEREELGAIAVDALPPNQWGLYQMHGNVWEWCADAWVDSHEGIDRMGAARPASQQASVTARVIRGGSWQSTTPATCVPRIATGTRQTTGTTALGFRCASVQPAPASPGGRDARAPEREAEPRSGNLTAARSNYVMVSPGRAQTLPQPAGPFVLRTDLVEMTFQRITRSDLGWANALGRDRYGLWARVTIDETTTPLRWIPPGQFVIGSPADEAGRWDDEGPQTDITIADGFWLMDAPVTQALWQSVMDENPKQVCLAGPTC